VKSIKTSSYNKKILNQNPTALHLNLGGEFSNGTVDICTLLEIASIELSYRV